MGTIFKKGDKTEPGNYRPVRLTSVICKTMDNLVRETIVKHMSANKLFSNKQFGFISGRSTTLQLLKVMDEWTKILDKGGKIDSVYMDFMKAFDKDFCIRCIGIK
jgi:limonene-1,2-epoxide hydrolase